LSISAILKRSAASCFNFSAF